MRSKISDSDNNTENEIHVSYNSEITEESYTCSSKLSHKNLDRATLHYHHKYHCVDESE